MDKRIAAMQQRAKLYVNAGETDAALVELLDGHINRVQVVEALLANDESARTRVLAFASRHNPGESLEGLEDALKLDTLCGRLILATRLAPRTLELNPTVMVCDMFLEMTRFALDRIVIEQGTPLAKTLPRMFFELHSVSYLEDAFASFQKHMAALGNDNDQINSMLIDVVTHAVRLVIKCSHFELTERSTLCIPFEPSAAQARLEQMIRSGIDLSTSDYDDPGKDPEDAIEEKAQPVSST